MPDTKPLPVAEPGAHTLTTPGSTGPEPVGTADLRPAQRAGNRDPTTRNTLGRGAVVGMLLVLSGLLFWESAAPDPLETPLQWDQPASAGGKQRS